jgi:hypothetical protein
MEDLKFISGKFSEVEIPKSHRFLFKYFTTDIQVAFVKYFWVFRDWSNFVDHTGFFCSERYLRKQADMFYFLLDVYEKNQGKLYEENMIIIQKLNEGKLKIS